MSAPDPFAAGGWQDGGDPAIAALRRECEAIAAEYRAPLPAGDDGLVAAVQRWRDLRPRHRLTSRGFHVTIETEKAIVEPIATAAEIEFEDMIERTPAEGLAGVAAKLHYAVESDLVDIEDIGGAQLVEVIEAEIAKAQPAP